MMFGYKEVAKGAGDMLKVGFFAFIGLAIFAVVAVLAIIGIVLYLVFSSGTTSTAEAPTAVQTTAPAITPIQVEYPIIEGLCFRTPMGDVGMVLKQDRDLLEMTFRGGVKSTYSYNQVVHADCGVLPKG
jgi:hypothetical protein